MIIKSLIKPDFMVLTLIVLMMLTFSTKTIASDETANSCSASDIKSAIDKVISSGGGTVHIPACQADNTWGDNEYIDVNTDVPFRLKGAGMDNTVIGYQDGANIEWHKPMFFDGGGLIELSDFTFRGSEITGLSGGIRIYSMETENLRIHHMRIQKFKGTALNVCQNPNSPMVIDHCEIGDQWKESPDARGYMYGVRVTGTNDQSDFIVPPSFGINNPNAVFIEDNVFDDCYHSVSGFTVSNIVFRYNTVVNPSSHVDAHGPCYDIGCRRSGDPKSGTYIFESYNNDLTRSGWCHNIRGGTGIVTDNIYNNCDPGFRLEMEGCSEGSSCSSSQDCPYSTTDTSKCYQSPKYWWIWNNTCNNCGSLFGYNDKGSGCIRENKEYYLRAPKAGDPVESYSKYTYPHPLVSGGSPPDTTPPETPQNVEIVN